MVIIDPLTLVETMDQLMVVVVVMRVITTTLVGGLHTWVQVKEEGLHHLGHQAELDMDIMHHTMVAAEAEAVAAVLVVQEDLDELLLDTLIQFKESPDVFSNISNY